MVLTRLEPCDFSKRSLLVVPAEVGMDGGTVTPRGEVGLRVECGVKGSSCSGCMVVVVSGLRRVKDIEGKMF